MIIKAVIFDLDGTLTHFTLDYKALRVETRQYLVEKGLPESLFSLDESIFEMLKKAEFYLKNNGKEGNVSTIKMKVFSLADEFELDAAHKTSLLPGVIEVLNVLKKMKLKIGLCTIDGRKATEYILNSFQINNFFDAVITRDDVSQIKPETLHLQTTLKQLKVKPEECLVVGDSHIDMKMARELNVRAVGVTTGLSSLEKLVQAGATCLASSLTDIPILVEELAKKEK